MTAQDLKEILKSGDRTHDDVVADMTECFGPQEIAATQVMREYFRDKIEAMLAVIKELKGGK